MPRTQRIPSYRLHKARGLAVVDIGGRRYYLGKFGSESSKAEYDRLIGEWLARGRSRPVDFAEESLAVVEVIAAYHRHAKDYYRKHGKPTRELGCIKEASKVLRQRYGTHDANQFGPLALQSVRAAMIELGWTRKYVNKQVGRIVRMFKWATANELVPASVYQALATLDGLKAGRTAAPDRPPVQPVDDATIEQTLPWLPPVVADMVRFQRLTGCRPGEVCELRSGDINRDYSPWVYSVSSHKTAHQGRARTILIGRRAQDVIRPYLLRAADAYCFSPAESEGRRRAETHERRQTPMSCGNRPGTNRSDSPSRPAGRKYTTACCRRAIERAGVTRWTPNQLRHAIAAHRQCEELHQHCGPMASRLRLGA